MPTPAKPAPKATKPSSKPANPKKRSHATTSSTSSLPITKKPRTTPPTASTAFKPSAKSAPTTLPTSRPPRHAPAPAAKPEAEPAHEPFLAIPKDLGPVLDAGYNVQSMRIISSSKMNAKISRSLSTLLGTIDLSDIKCKPGLVVLYASAPVGSKLVSIVEVVKREIEAEGKKNGGKVGRWWQYSGVGEEIVEVRPQGKGGKKGKGGSSSQPIELDDEEGEKMDLDAEEKEGGKEDGDGDEEESEPYFEPLKKVEQQVGKKFKAGAVLTVYLSRVPVKELEKVYGVQTNSKT